MVPINYLAVLVAAIVGMVLGFLWYGPIFGKMWMGLMGMSEETMKDPAKKKSMGTAYLIMTIGTLLMSFVLAHSLIFGNAYLNMSGWTAGLQGAFWNWLGFIAPVTVGTVLWEGKSWKLWFLNAGYYLVSLLIMGVILAVWM